MAGLCKSGDEPPESLEASYEGRPESKERLRIQSAHLFYCNRSLVCCIQSDVENCLMQSYVETCHVVIAGLAVAIVVPTVRCEMLFVFCSSFRS